MAEKAGDDRRRSLRFKVKIEVDYAAKGMFLSNYVTNLSKGGIFIRTDAPLPIRSQIDLTFTLPAIDTTIKARGRVAWTYDIKKGTSEIVPGMGIKFTDMSPENKATIQEYLQDLSSRAEAAQ